MRKCTLQDSLQITEGMLLLVFWKIRLKFFVPEIDSQPVSMQQNSVIDNNISQIYLSVQQNIKFAARLLPVNITCLPRSLTLVSMLQRRNLGAKLHIGMKKSESEFLAHAWVTLNGVVINDGVENIKNYSTFKSQEVNFLPMGPE